MVIPLYIKYYFSYNSSYILNHLIVLRFISFIFWYNRMFHSWNGPSNGISLTTSLSHADDGPYNSLFFNNSYISYLFSLFSLWSFFFIYEVSVCNCGSYDIFCLWGRSLNHLSSIFSLLPFCLLPLYTSVPNQMRGKYNNMMRK